MTEVRSTDVLKSSFDVEVDAVVSYTSTELVGAEPISVFELSISDLFGVVLPTKGGVAIVDDCAVSAVISSATTVADTLVGLD